MHNNDSIDLILGVIGYGRWGRNVARDFANTAGVRLGAVVDTDTEALAHARKKFSSIRTAEKFEDIVEEIDALAVCTPATCHFEHALAALEAGKHVFIEKPLAMKTTEATLLDRRAKETGRVLMVGHQMLHHELFRNFCDVLDGGRLGVLHSIHCERSGEIDWSKDPDALWGYGPHDMAMLIALADSRPQVRNAIIRNRCPDRDIVEALEIELTLEGGAEARVRLDGSAGAAKIRRIEAVCDFGTIVFDDVVSGGGELKVTCVADDCLFDLPPRTSLATPLETECRHFAECVLKSENPLADGASGVEVVSLLEEIAAVARGV